MMNKQLTYRLSAAALAATLALPVMAAENFYLGASAGRSDARDACSDLNEISFVGSCDDTDTAWKLFGGYQLSPNLGFEAFYTDLGEFTASGTVSGLPASATAEADGFGAYATGTWPVGRQFGVFGKLGIFRWDLENRARVGNASASVSDDSIDLAFGLGARFNFNEMVGVQVEWERFNDVGDEDTTGQSDIDLLSAGVVLSF